MPTSVESKGNHVEQIVGIAYACFTDYKYLIDKYGPEMSLTFPKQGIHSAKEHYATLWPLFQALGFTATIVLAPIGDFTMDERGYQALSNSLPRNPSVWDTDAVSKNDNARTLRILGSEDGLSHVEWPALPESRETRSQLLRPPEMPPMNLPGTKRQQALEKAKARSSGSLTLEPRPLRGTSHRRAR